MEVLLCRAARTWSGSEFRPLLWHYSCWVCQDYVFLSKFILFPRHLLNLTRLYHRQLFVGLWPMTRSLACLWQRHHCFDNSLQSFHSTWAQFLAKTAQTELQAPPTIWGQFWQMTHWCSCASDWIGDLGSCNRLCLDRAPSLSQAFLSHWTVLMNSHRE